MRTFQRVWKDIQHFENMDLYITVLVAIGLAILNLVDVTLSSYIAPLTLSVLGLLAFTSLINRHHIDELREAFAHPESDLFLEQFPPEIKENFDAATEVWLVGISLFRTINFSYEKIEKKLRQGHKFKIMLVHPAGPGIEMAVSRNYARKDVAAKISIIHNVLQMLSDLQKIAPERFEVRTIQNSPSYGVLATNPETTSGILYLRHYPFEISTESLPRFVLRARDGKWYDFFKEEIQAMWNYGVDWDGESVKGIESHK